MKIFLDGYFDKNFGDDFMITTLCDFLTKENHEVYIKKYDCFVGDFVSKMPQTLNVIEDDSPQKLKKLGIKVYIKIGGSMFPQDSVKEGIFRYLTFSYLLRLKLLGIKVCILNCSISWKKASFGENANRLIFRIADFITCRDKSSYMEIKKQNKNVYCFSDILFHKLRVNNPIAIEDEVVGISSYMGHKLSQKKMNIQIRDFLLKTINNLINNNDKIKIKLFSFDGGYNSDLAMANALRDSSIDPKKIEIINYNGDIQTFLKQLNSCSSFIGTRFHSIVFALSNGLNLLPLIYEKKSESLLNDIAYRGNIIKLNNRETDELLFKFYSTKEIMKEIKFEVDNSYNHLRKLKEFLNTKI